MGCGVLVVGNDRMSPGTGTVQRGAVENRIAREELQMAENSCVYIRASLKITSHCIDFCSGLTAI